MQRTIEIYEVVNGLNVKTWIKDNGDGTYRVIKKVLNFEIGNYENVSRETLTREELNKIIFREEV